MCVHFDWSVESTQTSIHPTLKAEECNLSSEHDQKQQTDEAPGLYPGQMPELPLMAKVLSWKFASKIC